MELVYLCNKHSDIAKEDVKNFAFCSYLNKDDINKRNHTKLTQDILKQFELIKDILKELKLL